MRFVKLCLAATAALGVPSAVVATDAGTAARADQPAVVIPFSPPVGEEMTYRMTRSQTREGKPRDVTMDVYVTFSRSDDGFQMLTRFAPKGLAAGSPVEELLGRPLVFDVSADGTIAGVVNEDSYWKLIDEAVDRFLPKDMKDDPQGEALVRRLMADMRKLPDDQRLLLLAKNYRPLLEMTGSEMTIGETVEAADEATLPFPSLGNVVLQRQIRMTLQSANQETAVFKVVTTVDPKSMQSAIESMMQLAPPEKRKPVPPMNFRQEATYVVSAKTGLTQSYEEVIEAEGGGDDGRRVTKLTRLPK